ncbi:MAG: BatD family protein [Bacteroidales bacterium]|nr:BatD family protein [Bacteroidales bacterium]
MNRLDKYLKIALTLLFSIVCVSLMAQVSCTAQAPSQVGVGQAFRYQVTLNEKPSKILNTNFGSFDVLNGPSQGSSSSISIINGQMTKSSSYSYTYTLAATKEGQLTIPGVTFSVNGSQVKSNSVTVNVVKDGDGGGQSQAQGRQRQQQQQSQGFNKKDVFVKAYCSNNNPYVGEQVIITHKLYVGPSVNGGYQVTHVNAPTQSGLWSYTLGNPDADAPRTTEVVDGKKYTVFEVRKTAVFPQKSGKITVTPFEIGFVARVIYTQQSNDPFDMFFGGRQYAQDYELDLKSNSVVLNCKALPENKQPEDFSGLAGNFKLSSNLSRNTLKTNDAANLTITVSGTGNLQHVEAPVIEFPSDFDVTDPKITDNINIRGNSVTGSRTFEYIVIPREAGDFTIPAATFSYFDPQSHTYKTLTTEVYTLKVEKGKGGDVTTVSSANQKDIKFLSKDIRYIKTNGKAFHSKKTEFYASPWFYVGIFLPLLLLVVFVIVWKKSMETRQDVALIKDRRANKVAKKRLKRAGQLLKTEQKEDFYVEISQVLWGYMSDKFHIPLSQLSMDTVEEKLKQKNVLDEDARDFLDTLNQCEFARFAPGDSSQMMNEMYQRAHDFMTKIERR